ncbi:MAG: HAD family hydrolase [Candidatus Ornithomonoglobus sp.]
MKGAIFDVDGTILDSMGIWVDITADFFFGHGVKISPEDNLKYQSMTLEETLPQIQRDYLPDMKLEDMLAEFVDLTRAAYRDTIPAKSGVCEYMKRLHSDGVKIAVATSGFKELCQSAFRRLGIFDIIDAYAFSAEVGCNKSQPDIYLLAAKRLGLNPGDCTVYEDIITGIMSAKEAGFKTVAVYDKTSVQDKERLLRHSDRYITGWKELLSK